MPNVEGFFHQGTSTISYLVADEASGRAAIVDPVLDYDHPSGSFSTHSADKILARAEAKRLAIEWILETHAHADHLTAAQYLKTKTRAPVAIGEHIRTVQSTFSSIFNLTDLSCKGSEFDRLLADGERFRIGGLSVEVLHTPGHTPACVSYRVGDSVFVGDTLFMPDYGTARADFPGGSASTLYRSIQRLLSLPDETRVFLCHDYLGPSRKEHIWETSVREERANNVHLQGGDEAAFVAMRRARDATLSPPVLLLPSIQVNIRAGHFPKPESNGVSYLKIPVRALNPELGDPTHMDK